MNNSDIWILLGMAIVLGFFLGLILGYVNGSEDCYCPTQTVTKEVKINCTEQFEKWQNESIAWQEVAEQVNKTLR